MFVTRRSALVLGCALALASITLDAQKGKEPVNTPPAARKLSNEEKREVAAVVKAADDLTAGTAAPNDLSLSWAREDLLKAQNNKEYVPFSVTIDGSKITATNLSVYWRVVSKDAAAAPPPAPPADGKKDEKAAPPPKPAYAYEDYGQMAVTPGSSTLKINRSFTVPAGDYEVYFVAKEPTSDKKGAPAPKMSAIKQSVNVPELWTEDLTTSSVIVAERIDPLPAPLTPQQQVERPYALGAMEIVPALDTKFTKKAELSTFVLIYNAKTDSLNKPNVTVEYNFYTKQAGAEKFFNKTNPQALNAQTLPPNFDVAAGHQLQSGQAVPLASFPEGDYRLEIKVTDNVNNKSVTRNVNFSVSGS